MQTKIIERYFFFGLLLATLIFTFMVFRPFWIVLTLGVSFAIVLKPMYMWFKKYIPASLSALTTVVLFAIILLGPILGIIAIVFNQSQDLYQYIVSQGGTSPFIDTLNQSINGFLPAGVDIDVKDKVSELIISLSNNIAQIFSTTLSTIFSFILMLLAVYYFLKDGSSWKQALISLSPLSDNDDKKIIEKITIAINGVIKGYLLIAVVQGFLMSIGLWIFDVPNAALWGVVAGLTSLIPMLGTAVVSAPAIIFLFLTGDTVHAIGLLTWSAVLVGLVDNFLNPVLISGKTHIPPLLILFAVLGGLSLFGPIGVLVGPLCVSLLYVLVSIYRTEYSDEKIV